MIWKRSAKLDDASRDSLSISNLYFCVILTILTLVTTAHARLHESPSQAIARYGAPVKESSIIMLPLFKGTNEIRYYHNGWRIRSAFLNDQAVIISYMKLVRQSTPDALLQNDEIQAILKAESGGYQWMKVKRGKKLTNSKKYQGNFNISTRVWIRGDGAVSWVSGNSVLSVISREGLNYDVHSQNQKETQRKSSIKDF